MKTWSDPNFATCLLNITSLISSLSFLFCKMELTMITFITWLCYFFRTRSLLQAVDEEESVWRNIQISYSPWARRDSHHLYCHPIAKNWLCTHSHKPGGWEIWSSCVPRKENTQHRWESGCWWETRHPCCTVHIALVWELNKIIYVQCMQKMFIIHNSSW